MDMYSSVRSLRQWRLFLLIFIIPLLSTTTYGVDLSESNQELMQKVEKMGAQLARQARQIADQDKEIKALEKYLAVARTAGSDPKPAAATATHSGVVAKSSSLPAGGVSSPAADGKPTTDEQSGSKEDTLLTQLDSAFDVPDSPAAAILGVAPQKVTHPTTPQAAIGSVISAIDENGNFQAGVAIDVSPYHIYESFISGRKFDDRVEEKSKKEEGAGKPDELLDLNKYFSRLAERTQLSLVTTKGTEAADKSTRVAFGIQTTLMDENDPIYRDFLAKANRDVGKVTHDVRKVLGLNYDEVNNNNSWHYNSSWDLGAAQVLINRDGVSGNFRSGATGVYSTYAYGFEGVDHIVFDQLARTMQSHAQLLLDVRYLDHDIVPDSTKKGTFMDENSLRGSLRLRMGYPTFNFGVIESVTREWLVGRENTSHETDIAVEWQMQKAGPWLTASVGKEFNRSDGKSPVLALGGVKFGLSKNP